MNDVALPTHDPHALVNTPSTPWTRLQIACLVALGVIEVLTALYLATLNPIQGYDENWYLINAHRFAGETPLPYAVHRPPLLPLLLAVFGAHRWLISGLAHIGAAAVLLFVLRRLTSAWVALSGVVLFVVCADIRLYNVLTLTEMPGILLTLTAILCYINKRPFLAGGTCLLLFMLHWGYMSVIPAFVLVYFLQRRWREGALYAAGLAVAAVPFLIGFAMMFSDPLAPVKGSFAIQRDSTNDLLFYVRTFPQLAIGLFVGGAAALAWLIRRPKEWFSSARCGLVMLLLAMVGSRVSMLHVYESKGIRYLIPAVPALLLLSILMLDWYAVQCRRVATVAWALLAVSLIPTEQDFYEIYGLAMDPTHAVVDLRDAVAAFPDDGPIYTDHNDLAVMGQTGRPTVAVSGDGTWHHYFSSRPNAAREQIPTGALYLTWDPGVSEVLARADSPRSGTFYLVRWNRTTATTASLDPTAPVP